MANQVGRRDIRERKGAGAPSIECEQARGAEVRRSEEQADHQRRRDHECRLARTDQCGGDREAQDEDVRAPGSCV